MHGNIKRGRKTVRHGREGAGRKAVAAAVLMPHRKPFLPLPWMIQGNAACVPVWHGCPLPVKMPPERVRRSLDGLGGRPA